MSNQHKFSSHAWNGIHAKYRTSSTLKLNELLPETAQCSFDQYFQSSDDKTSETNLLITKKGLRCEWIPSKMEKTGMVLIQTKTADPVLILKPLGVLRPFPKNISSKQNAARIIDSRQHVDPKYGNLRIIEMLAHKIGQPSIRLRVELLESVSSPFLATFWSAILPNFSGVLENPGLPTKVVLSVDQTPEQNVTMELIQFQKDSFDPVNFIPSDDVKLEQPQVEQKRFPSSSHKSKSLSEVRSILSDSKSDSTKSAAYFSASMPDEDLKIIVRDEMIEKAYSLINTASSYLGRFEGERFIFDTSNWVDQIVQNTPNPQTDQDKSVFDWLLSRTGIQLLTSAIEDLDTTAFQGDIQSAVDALQDLKLQIKWNQFLVRVARKNKQADLNNLLTEVTNGNTLTIVLTIVLGDYATDRNIQQFVQLGRLWLVTQFSQLDVRPDLPAHRQDPEADVYYSGARREVFIEGVAEMIDIELSDWEHAIDFGNQPLLGPLKYTQGILLNALAALFPNLDIQPVRFGFFTSIRVKSMAFSFDVEITPTLSPATIFLGLKCPPCLLALYQYGHIDVEVPDIEIPVFIYCEQSSQNEPPVFRCMVGEINHGDIDFISIVIGFFPYLSAAISIIGTVFGDDVLSAVLASLGEEIQRPLNELLTASIDKNDFNDDNLVNLLSNANIIRDDPYDTDRVYFEWTIDSQNELNARLSQLGIDSNTIDSILTMWQDFQKRILNPGMIAKLDYESFRQTFPNIINIPTITQTVHSGCETSIGKYQLESAGVLADGLNNHGPLVFPRGGADMDCDVALVMSDRYVHNTVYDLERLDFSGLILTEKLNGDITEVDWWLEAPDQNGMPPRPAKAQQGQPPNIIMTPSINHPGFWGYSSLIFVWPIGIRLRDLDNAPADEPFADLTVDIRINVGATHFVPVSYNVCEEVTHLIARLLDPRKGLIRKTGRTAPRYDTNGLGRSDPIGVMVGDTFHRLANPSCSNGEPTPGMLDNTRFSYIYGFGRQGHTPLPDSPGPQNIPGATICRTVTTWDKDEEETWLDATSRISIPLYLGYIEQYALADSPSILPWISYRLDTSEIVTANIPLQIQTDGPLATMSLPDNQEWLKQLIIAELLRLYSRYGYIGREIFEYYYGTNNLTIVPHLEPENLTPETNLQLERLTTFETAVSKRHLALKFMFNENFLHRI